MKQSKTLIKHILNLSSYLMISLSLFAILFFPYSPKHILNFTFLSQNNQFIVLYHKNYRNLSQNDAIYYYHQNQLKKDIVQQINPAKYQIQLQNNQYTIPSNYIGAELYTIPFSISISKMNSIVFIALLFPLSSLLLIIKLQKETKQKPSSHE